MYFSTWRAKPFWKTVSSDCTQLMCCRRELVLSETSIEHMQKVSSTIAVGREESKRMLSQHCFRLTWGKGWENRELEISGEFSALRELGLLQWSVLHSWKVCCRSWSRKHPRFFWRDHSSAFHSSSLSCQDSDTSGFCKQFIPSCTRTAAMVFAVG